MKFLMTSSLVVLVSVFAFNAKAGKAEDVQAAIKSACGKDVSSSDALRLTKTLFLCSPGSKVDADGCQVECLKKTEGAEVGK